MSHQEKALRMPSGAGIKLRDYFAASALQGLLAHPTPMYDWQRRLVAEDAYKLADDMLNARELDPAEPWRDE
jgi:hypothetical protein